MYLPTDHKCAIRQGFAASLLLTPLLFFLNFWWNVWSQMRRECGSRAYIGGQSRSPEGGGRQAPLAPTRPLSGTYLQIRRKKLQTGPVAAWACDRGIVSKIFETQIYFWNFLKRKYFLKYMEHRIKNLLYSSLRIKLYKKPRSHQPG